MRFKQHIPNSVEVKKPLKINGDFNKILSHKWINQWTKHPGFVRFSYSEVEGQFLLMAEYTKEWWVLGYLDEKPELPLWIDPSPVSSLKL